MSWIWLDPVTYPELQKNYSNINGMTEEERGAFLFCVAEFTKTCTTGQKIVRADLTVSADSFFRLYANGEFVGLGPAASGGDFLCKGPAPKHYANTYTLMPGSDTLSFRAQVRLLPQVLTDYARGQGGFCLSGRLTLEDGTVMPVETDETWTARPDTAYTGFCAYDSTRPAAEAGFARAVEDRWQAAPAPIPMLTFQKVLEESVTAAPGETHEAVFETERIWGVYPTLTANGPCEVTLSTCELAGQAGRTETARFGAAGEYTSFLMHSAARYILRVVNTGTEPCTVVLKTMASFYPCPEEGTFRCSDPALNRVMDLCRHTLRICRQSLHLDSTTHQELLACTGDYYIESLMTLYLFGDLRLSALDVRRTADWLAANDGRMFHTTYSLIWVQMLWDVYRITGEKALLSDSAAALDTLLARFRGYLGESGVLETPPDFMFVDWTVIDGCSMHHPPKALGQTVLNAFWYEALNRAADIYAVLGREEDAADCLDEAAAFRTAFNREFYDAARGLYFDGKNDPWGPIEPWLPANPEKRYFSKYSNILACLYGLTDGDTARRILREVTFDDTLQDIQPYFMHYLLSAVRKAGLFAEFGMQLLSRWKPLAAECDKGLKEGWIAPEPTYSFDHSHAWGGTFAYQLPQALTGMEILEPGMSKLAFTPNLYGLDFAELTIPTPMGTVSVRLEAGKAPEVTVPEGMEAEVR